MKYPIPDIAAIARSCGKAVIRADHDSSGLEAAHCLAQRLIIEGKEVRIALPPKNQDFNDLLKNAHTSLKGTSYHERLSH